jgi:hypothetical protein
MWPAVSRCGGVSGDPPCAICVPVGARRDSRGKHRSRCSVADSRRTRWGSRAPHRFGRPTESPGSAPIRRLLGSAQSLVSTERRRSRTYPPTGYAGLASFEDRKEDTRLQGVSARCASGCASTQQATRERLARTSPSPVCVREGDWLGAVPSTDESDLLPTRLRALAARPRDTLYVRLSLVIARLTWRTRHASRTPGWTREAHDLSPTPIRTSAAVMRTPRRLGLWHDASAGAPKALGDRGDGEDEQYNPQQP